jgi:hypothetical protein
LWGVVRGQNIEYSENNKTPCFSLHLCQHVGFHTREICFVNNDNCLKKHV